MNTYEISLGISPAQKKDYITYRPQIDHDYYSAHYRHTKRRTKEGLHRCKEAITSLITKGSIPVWGLKVLIIKNSGIAGL
jgi:hypothetical protein